MSQYYQTKQPFRHGGFVGRPKERTDSALTSSSEEEVITRRSRDCVAGFGISQHEREVRRKSKSRNKILPEIKTVSHNDVVSAANEKLKQKLAGAGAGDKKAKAKQVAVTPPEDEGRGMYVLVTFMLLVVICPMTRLLDATKILGYLGNTFAVFLMILAPAFIAENVLEGEAKQKNRNLIRAFYAYACIGALGFVSLLYIDLVPAGES